MIEIKTYTNGQVHTMNKYERLATLFARFDSSLRAGHVETFTQSPETKAPYRTYEDKPFVLRFDATAINGLYIAREGYKKSMHRERLDAEMAEIDAKLAQKRQDAQLRNHIAIHGGE